uniref:Histone H2A/H2B/H3 domain-containing protein n=1 Tax=Oryza nivara TaxID=4536 RepID=A0A0E0FLV2_ORYNI
MAPKAEKKPAKKKPKAEKRLSESKASSKEGGAGDKKGRKKAKKSVEIYIFKVLKQTSVCLVLPGELAKHAVSEGTKAVTNSNKTYEHFSWTECVIGDGGDAVIGDGGGGLQRLPRRRPWSRGGGRVAPESTPPAKYARGRRPRRGSGGHAPHPESGGGGGGGGGAREWRDVGTTMRGGGGRGRGRGKSAQAADRCCRRMPMDGGPPTPTLAEVLSLSPPTTPRSRAPSSSRRRRMAAQTLATTAAGGQTAAEVARPPDSTPPAESGEEGGVGVHTGEEGKAAAAGEGSDPFFPIIAAPSLPSPTQPPLLLPRHRGALLVTEEIGRRRRCRWEAATARDGDGATTYS